MQNPVSVRLADEDEYKHVGRMDFVDNALNAKTGTIRGRAIFENKDGFLTPGYFGRLRLYGGEGSADLVPDSAIASDQASKIVFTVADDGTVGVKRVELGPIVDGLRVIRSGLTPTDRIVIEGLQRARPGQKVTPEMGKIEAVAPASGETELQITTEAAVVGFSHFFIDRPIFAAVISILLTLVGAISFRALPITEYPEIAPPTVVVNATFAGASAEVIAQTVAAPIEQEINGVDNMIYVVSQSTGNGAAGDQRRVPAGNQYRSGASAGAEPRLDRAAAIAAGGAAHRRHRAQEFAGPDAGHPSDLAGRQPRPAIHFQLRQHQHQGRYHAH